jgi:hypothetical protein
MTNIPIEVIGWAGACLILLAYGLLSAGKLTARSKSYQWMNVAGAAAFVVNSGWNGAYPSAVLNVIWIGIGAWALLRRWQPATQEH